MKKISKKKTCFLITPIGSPDSSERLKLKQWTELIYGPALRDKYQLIIANLISTPGVITKQIIDNIIDSDLVIIDFSPDEKSNIPNSNVMYEAAIRHIAKKPYIQIAPTGLRLPFDINHFRCVLYNPRDLSYPKKLQKELKKVINEMNEPGYIVPDIIGHTFDLERIVSDPKKFIQLLKEALFSKNNDISGFQNAINYGTSSFSPSSSISASSSFTGTYSHTSSHGHVSSINNCPNCSYSVGLMDQIISLDVGAASVRGQSYKCPNCGTIFSV